MFLCSFVTSPPQLQPAAFYYCLLNTLVYNDLITVHSDCGVGCVFILLEVPWAFCVCGFIFFMSLKLKVDPLILDHRTIVPETVFLFPSILSLCASIYIISVALSSSLLAFFLCFAASHSCSPNGDWTHILGKESRVLTTGQPGNFLLPILMH